MKRYSLIVFLALTLNSFAAAQASDVEYRVYDAVIANMFAGGKVTFDTKAAVKHLVIRDTTITQYASGDKENWEQVKVRLRNKLTDDTITDFESKLKKATEFKRTFDIDLEYSLLSVNDHDSIFDRRDNFDGFQKNWVNFYEKFPDSGGYISLSNVGFNKAEDQALVYFVHWCGGLCGTGAYILLKKVERSWSVDEAGLTWIS